MIRLRDDIKRLNRSSYPWIIEMRASFGDVDGFRHLNNVALSRFIEEGRASLNAQVFDVASVLKLSEDTQILMANLIIDFIGQGEYPGTIIVATGISRIGRSSFIHQNAIFQEDRCIVLSESALVYAVSGSAQPLPDEIRARMERYLILSEAQDSR